MGNRVTIQDIADELGLSRNTVSKALNTSEGIAEATKARIISKAVEMGYKQFAYANIVLGPQPGSAQRILPAKSEIALLTTTYLSSPHFSSLMLDRFQYELSQLGYTLNAHRVSQVNLMEKTLPITLDTSRIAAIVCIEMFDYDYDSMLCSLGIPTLFVDCPARVDGRMLPSDHLIMDNTTEIMRLVNIMAEKGCKRVGFVGNHLHCQSFFERYTAFRTAMMLKGLPVREEDCIPFNFVNEIKPRIEALETLPDLFICANDFVAMDTLLSLRELGKDVPRDIFLAGFDDSAESRTCMPPLTTIHIHTQVMAFSAVQLIRTRIKEPDLDFRQVYTDTDLIERASTQR